MIVLGALAGLVVGSFLARLVVEWPPSRDVMFAPRSRCPLCHKQLSWRELVPLFSFLAQRGRCKCGSLRLDRSYFCVEFASGVVGGTSMLLSPPTGIVVALAGWTLILASAIDLKCLTLPDRLTLALIVLALVSSFLGSRPDPTETALGGLIAGSLFFALAEGYRRLRKIEALGFGDVKLACAIGLWVGASELPTWLLMSGLIGLAFAWQRGAFGEGQTPVPFGPAMAMAAWPLMLIVRL